jgi:DNA-binding transcriptional LysR family regulator
VQLHDFLSLFRSILSVSALRGNTLQKQFNVSETEMLERGTLRRNLMDRIQSMTIFVKVAEARGFAEVARQMMLSPAGVTRAVATLERVIGTKLLTRTTRSVKLTEAGSQYYEDCKRILADVAEAEAAAAGSFAKPNGTLTVSAPVNFGRMHVLPVLTEFLDQHPAVTGRTLFLDRIVNLVEEGADVAVRIGHLPDSGLHAIRVGEVRRVLCASPGYVAKFGLPKVPADLASHQVIASMSAWISLDWHFEQPEKVSVTVRPRLMCNTNEASIDAAVSGWGITRILAYQVSQHVAAGRLEILLESFEEPPLPIHVVYVEGRGASAKVRAFVDLATRRLRETMANGAAELKKC